MSLGYELFYILQNNLPPQVLLACGGNIIFLLLNSINNHFCHQYFVHNHGIALNMKYNIQFFVSGSQLLCMGVIPLYCPVSTFGNNVGKIPQRHYLRPLLLCILGSMFSRAYLNDEVCNIINISEHYIKNPDRVFPHNLSCIACSNCSTNSSTVCSLSLEIGCVSSSLCSVI